MDTRSLQFTQIRFISRTSDDLHAEFKLKCKLSPNLVKTLKKSYPGSTTEEIQEVKCHHG